MKKIVLMMVMMLVGIAAFADVFRIASFSPKFEEAVMMEHEFVRFVYIAKDSELSKMETYLKEFDKNETTYIIEQLNSMAQELPVNKEFKTYGGKCYAVYTLEECYD